MKFKLCLGVVFGVLVWAGSGYVARSDERTISTAATLMERRMFRDAGKMLEASIEKQGDSESGQELRMAGESYYLLGEYGKSRNLFLRALPLQTTTKGKMVCEFRLALLEYRLGDFKGASERIETFIRRYPSDERVGTLAVVQIRIILEGKGGTAGKIKQVEAEYEKIASDRERYGYYNFVLASQSLGQLYIDAGNEQKAASLFVKAVHDMRSLITSLQTDGKPVPKDLLQGVDGMSLQIAKNYLDRKDYGEAQKWLENVSYDEGLMAQAKYLLAQLAYQKREYGQVLYLLQDDLIAKTPAGDTKWAMCLLAGFAWRDCRMPDLEKAKEFLKKIPAAGAGYEQAQHGLGDIYREQKDGEKAELHYLESVKNPKYAPPAHYYLAEIYKARAEAMKPKTDEEKKEREALFRKAGAHVQELLLKYPLTDVAKQAKAMVAALVAQGIQIDAEASEDEKIAAWEKTAKEKPGSNEAAQALLSLAQHHSRTALDPKTKVVTRAPNWQAVAESCAPILKSPQPFTNVSAERWQELRARAYYYAGRAELGSLPPGSSEKRLEGRNALPVRMPQGGSAARALENLGQAQRMTQEKQQPDFFRELDYALMEAMFKSDDRAVRDEGEKRYAEMETKYGSDPNYQRLAIVTADWLDDHGQHELAGRTYRNIARKGSLDRDEVIHLLHLAGVSYGKAGRTMMDAKNQSASLAFMVQPRAAIKTATSIYSAYKPFQFTKRIVWDREGPDPTAGEVLMRISREFGVPFVWRPEGAVANYMKQTVIPRSKILTWQEPRTLAKYFASVVNTNRFDVDYDLGVTGGAYTMPAKPIGELSAEDIMPLEIFDSGEARFPSLARPYGDFAAIHRGPALLFSIVKHVEETTGARVIWNEGVQKDEALAREFRSIPGVSDGQSAGCADVLRAVLESVGLRYEVVRRDRSREMLQESNDSFDELRRFGAGSSYAEDAMFNIGVNMYILKEYGKMKLLLREYLKTFDSPQFAHYYDACFWLGRLFELDKNYREAIKYYGMASEERVVVFRPKEGTAAPTLEEIKSRLSYDTLFNLSRKATHPAGFKDARLEGGILSFIRFNTNVEIGLDPSARGLEATVTRPAFSSLPCIELLHGVLVDLGLDLRTENGDTDVAERAYYRIALVYKEDNLMREALEYVNTMLSRFPQSPRRVDGLKLKLDIYKGLKDYANALSALEELKVAAVGKIEPFRLDYEIGRIHFDLCDYGTAEQAFSRALSGTNDPEEWFKIREALAVTYLRTTNRWADALSTYRNIVQYETSPVRQSVNALMIWFLECATARPPESRPLPEREMAFIKMYEALSEKQRAEMGPNELARATWVYFASAMADLYVRTNRVDALREFEAASGSPDSFLAGEALYEAGRLRMADGEYRQAKETFEHLLFATKAVEPTVKATYALGECWKALGEDDAAFRRFDEVVQRFPISPYAALAKMEPLYIARKPPEVVPAPAGTGVVVAVTGSVARAAGPATVQSVVPAAPAGQGAALIAMSEAVVPAGTGTVRGASVTNAGSGASK